MPVIQAQETFTRNLHKKLAVKNLKKVYNSFSHKVKWQRIICKWLFWIKSINTPISWLFHSGWRSQWLLNKIYHENNRKLMKTKTTPTGRPIVLHSSRYLLDSFRLGMELCSIACKKFVQEKTCIRLTGTCTILLYKTTCTLHKFLVQVSWAFVTGISVAVSITAYSKRCIIF